METLLKKLVKNDDTYGGIFSQSDRLAGLKDIETLILGKTANEKRYCKGNCNNHNANSKEEM